MNETPRGPWYLLTGLALGLALGLFYAWALAPANEVDTSPDTLQTQYKEQYRAMIALAYLSDGDVGRARARLSLLGDRDPVEALTIQAQRALTADNPDEEAYALGKLAADLGGVPRPQDSPAPTDTSKTSTATPSPRPTATRTPAPTATPTALPTSRATFTPLPTRTPTATPGAPFILEERTFLCNPDWTRPLLRVDVRDASRQPVPGVPITVSWAEGEEIFYTGLKPDLGLGIADFEMTPGITYTLVAGQGGQVIGDLQAAECEGEDGARYWGSWMLTFVQP